MGSSPKTLQAIVDAPGVRGKNVAALWKDGLPAFIQSIISTKHELQEPFYVLDLGVVMALFDQWSRNLPMAQPFYAVKCNPNLALLGVLAALGSSFDCASKAEIKSVLSLGVSPSRIIFANPSKAEPHIKYAATVGVNLTTFDSKEELEKIRKWHPQCALLIRVKAPDDGGARCPLGSKYGALPGEVTPLLQAAQTARLTVTGVSFHIGSGGMQFQAYQKAIAAAKTVFETAARLGMPKMRVLNIGGGFTAPPHFAEVASTVKAALQAYFPNELGLTVIAEPGRFFAESAITQATNIIGKRVRGDLKEYWINDGIYGSLNCILNDHAVVTCMPLVGASSPKFEGARTYDSTVFGPTCDALDTVLKGYPLPQLQMNDWLVFPNMGAYTVATGSNFNGFNTSAILTYLAYSSPKLSEALGGLDCMVSC
ncbi:LOW QUALITY PROTEIN: ornithine decarboxylase-like [Herrania umbratica]|uniref:ornithine decarboxylase n=1 Tax=Herrania umbratica TaxID=108875 RepID=A0A6J1AC24_9ROSI|nr:LOW QUALITY PROTEIN: ornithine decarboxylase-like [Herrania umbratica]